jgi:hypothetical protein
MTIVLRLVKGSVLTHAEADGNFIDLDARAEKAQVLLTGSTVLTSASHANRRIQMNSASATNIDMPASPVTGERYFGINLGAGLLTLRTNAGAALTGNALLPATVDQYSPWEVWYTSSGFIRVA